MPKMRGIKPETWTDEKFVTLSPLARLLFIGMWNYACDNGHIAEKPSQIKMRVLPADDCDVRALLQEMVNEGMVVRSDGYLTIPALPLHQRIDKRYLALCEYCEGSDEAAQEAYIYYAKAGNHIKIGQTTQSLERRLSQLRDPHGGTIVHPDVERPNIQIVGAHPVSESLTESKVHWRFRALRTEFGEWFEVGPDLIEHILAADTRGYSRALTSTHVEGRKEGSEGERKEGESERSAAGKPRKKPAHNLPSSWLPSDDHIARCVGAGIDVTHEADKFRAHADANDRRQVNWNAAFTQWLLNARPTQRANVHPMRRQGEGPDDWMRRRL